VLGCVHPAARHGTAQGRPWCHSPQEQK